MQRRVAEHTSRGARASDVEDSFEIVSLDLRGQFSQRICEYIVGASLPQVAEQFLACVGAVPVHQNLKQIVGCTDSASPHPRFNGFLVASFVAVPAPLDLKDIVGVGLVPRGQHFLRGFANRSWDVSDPHVAPEWRHGSAPACQLHDAFLLCLLTV